MYAFFHFDPLFVEDRLRDAFLSFYCLSFSLQHMQCACASVSVSVYFIRPAARH